MEIVVFIIIYEKFGEGIRSKYNHHILSHFASDTLQYFDSITPVLSKGLSLDQLWQKVCGRYTCNQDSAIVVF